MNLLHRDERQIVRPDRGLKQTAIFRDIFVRIPFHETEIEHPLTVQRADTAKPRAESVHQPGQFLERGELQNLQAARFSKHPGRGNCATRSRAALRRAIPSLLYGWFCGGHNANSIIVRDSRREIDGLAMAESSAKGES